MRKRINVKRLTNLAMLLAVAFVLSWIEFVVSVPMVIPGIKIGLANLAILFSLYYCGGKDTFLVLCGRLLLNAMLFGSVVSLIYSAAGGLLSFAVMCLCKRFFTKHILTVSILGGIFHNIGQLLAAFVVLKTPSVLCYYAPYLIIGGIAAGAFNGIISNKILSCAVFAKKECRS